MSRRAPDTPEFTLFPRIVPEDYTGSLRITGEYGHTRFTPGNRYEYQLSSMRWRAASPRKKGALTGNATAASDGALSIPFAPDIHGEWMLIIDAKEDKGKHLPANLGLFVMPREHYHLRPYIGELHAHSTGSDGREEPVYTAIRARRLGFDFFALTDHRNYQTSVDMKEKAVGLLGNSMLLMNGEEMHPDISDDEEDPGRNHLYHFVAAGHSRSVRDLFLEGGERTQSEVREIVKELEGQATVPGLDLQWHGESIWKVRKAKELGGLTIFCHPYWAWSLNIDESDREQTFLDGEADAVEVFSTADPSNIMSNRFHDAASGGGGYAAVGVSDGHRWGPGTSMRQCTFVLADSLTVEGIVQAVRSGMSLACEEVSGGDGIPRIVGPLKLIDFAEFYFLRILPIKQRIMALEADVAFSGLKGGPFSNELITSLTDELSKLEKSLWA